MREIMEFATGLAMISLALAVTALIIVGIICLVKEVFGK